MNPKNATLTEQETTELVEDVPDKKAGMELCEIDSDKCLIPLGRYYQTVAEWMKDMRDHPEAFIAGKGYTLHARRPVMKVEAKQVFSVITAEG